MISILRICLLSILVFSANAYDEEVIQGEFLVKIKPESKDSFEKSVDFFQTISHDHGVYLIKRPVVEKLDYALEQVRSMPFVDWGEPNYIIRPQRTPNDEFFVRQWGLHNVGQRIRAWDGVQGIDINILRAWDITTGSKDITIAIMDTGLDMNVEEVHSNLWINEVELNGVPGVDDDGNGYVDDIHGYDFGENTAELTDSEGHGTHVTTTIGSLADNGLGTAGLVWHTRMMILKIFGGEIGAVSSAIQAIDYAIEKKARVINASWGGAGYSKILEDAMNRASLAGIVFVAASGNNYGNNDLPENDFYPANYDFSNVISVTAVNNRGMKPSFANYGQNKVHVAAPGEDIYAIQGDYWDEVEHYPTDYNYMTGTSMAAPHVTGVVALMLAQNPELPPARIREILIETSRPLPSLQGIIQSEGLIDAYQAVLLVSEKK